MPNELSLVWPTIGGLVQGASQTQLAELLDGVVVEAGLWRFYSSDFPKEGIRAWNSGSWRRAWNSIPEQAFFWGEDVFGNQLTRLAGSQNAYIWDHETGECCDFEEEVPQLSVFELLSSVASHGLNWLSFYNNGSLQVGRNRVRDLLNTEHLHWKTPLILGGEVREDNLSTLERHSHLVGHAQLWRQIKDCPPGTEIRLKRPRKS